MKSLPKWFDGWVGYNYETIKNPFTGASYECNPNEVAMYDLIMGIQITIDRKYNGLLDPRTRDLQITMRKGLDWFRKNNAKAYMILLD